MLLIDIFFGDEDRLSWQWCLRAVARGLSTVLSGDVKTDEQWTFIYQDTATTLSMLDTANFFPIYCF